MIKVRKFRAGKEARLEVIDRFYRDNGLNSTTLLDVTTTPLGPDRVEYVVTYDDTSTPTVETTFPGNGDRAIALGTTMVIVFSKAMNNLGVADITIYDVTNDATIATSEYTINNTNAGDTKGLIRVSDSGSYLVANTLYRVTLNTTITDTDGNTLASPYIFHFTTVTTSDPAAGQQAVVLAGAETVVVTTLKAYSAEPQIGLTPVGSSVGVSRDDDATPNGDWTWTFTVRIDDLAQAGGQKIDVIETGTVV
jgi:hypothetical protein